MGVSLQRNGESITIKPKRKTSRRDISVPADISSMAAAMVAALINPGSEVLIRNVGVNPLRTGVIDILKDRRRHFSPG
ncbi:MAG: hypothetical protein R3B51_11945 [Thermodesulfobacteriota bacterium]